MSVPKKEITERFNSIVWSGARLLGFQVMHDEDRITDNVCLEVKMLFVNPSGRKQWRYFDVLLKDCRFVRCGIDLGSKAVSGHAIDNASCSMDSILKARLEKKLRHERGISGRQREFGKYLHFHFSMVPAAGSIDVLSKDFDIRNE